MSLFDPDLASRDPRDIIVTAADFGDYVRISNAEQIRVNSDIYNLNERYAKLEKKVDEYAQHIDLLMNKIMKLEDIIEKLKLER